MNEFFVNSSLGLSLYIFSLILFLFAIFLNKKIKYIFQFSGLVLFVGDISYLLLIGMSLNRCAILCGLCVILVLISILVGGKRYEL